MARTKDAAKWLKGSARAVVSTDDFQSSFAFINARRTLIDTLFSTSAVQRLETVRGERIAYDFASRWAGLPDFYEEYFKGWHKAKTERAALAKSFVACASMAEASTLSKYARDYMHPSFGLVFRELYDRDWHDILLNAMAEVELRPGLVGLLRHHVYGLHYLDPFTHVAKILRAAAKLLQAPMVDPWIANDLAIDVPKRSLREFLKRVIFRDLQKTRVYSRSPNAAAAEVINVLLSARGEPPVRPNDIAQMNKSGRRRYHREK